MKNKIPYKNQEKVQKEAFSFLHKLVSKELCVKEAYVWASLAEGTFGIYEEEYNGRTCSDIDLVIIIDENYPLPKEWKYTTVDKSWFSLYNLGYFHYKNNKHEIGGLLVFPSKHNLDKMHNALKGRYKKII